MKKNNIVLWIASFVITFLTIFLANLLDKDYPLSGTFGIDGKKVSYRFEKTHYGKDDFDVIIRTDIEDIIGNIFWKNESDSIWNSLELKKSSLSLQTKIKSHKPLETIKYFVELNHKNKKYFLPNNKKVELTFYGKIPVMAKVLQFLLLYLGLFLAVRTGLEYFNNSEKSKKFAVLVVVVFLTLTALINPLYLTYKFGYMNSVIPEISKLFPMAYVLLSLLWIIALVLIFRFKSIKITSLITSIISIIIFVFMM
jgi:hypothetical protein